MDLSTSRSGNAHLGGLLERSVSADHGSVDGFGLRFAGLLRDVAAVLLVVISGLAVVVAGLGVVTAAA